MELTCIVPARNEQGHLRQLIQEILSIKQINEIFIVEGGSTDDTFKEAERIASENSQKVKVLRQNGKGKFNAVLTGAHHATNDFIIIWDADGTVPIESTNKLINNVITKGVFTMGDRLRGKIEKGAMQKLNFIGNWLFAYAWSPILGTKPVDMLCGTKIIEKIVFQNIPNKLLTIDPYGDFALVAAARALGRKIESIPVNYSKRTYGATNINRWTGGIRLFGITVYVYGWIIKSRISLKLNP